MRIIARPRIEGFWRSRKTRAERATAERDFMAWYKIARGAGWGNFGGLRRTFGSADQVGNCVVFDVGNNRFRLICRVNYARGIIYVLRPMDHEEYDKGRWIEGCGCHEPPPKAPTPGRAPAPRGRQGRE